MSFLGGSKGSSPKPVISAPQAVANIDSQSVGNKAEAERRKLLAKMGRQGTILTSPLGGQQQALGSIGAVA